MKTTFDALAILAAGTVHILSGFVLVYIGRMHAIHFESIDAELPLITQVCFSYTLTLFPILMGLLLGLATLLGLGLSLRVEKVRDLLPFLLSISFVVGVLHIVFVLFAVSIPLVRVMSHMG